MLNIHKILLDRLNQQGVDPNEAPPFLRDLSKIWELSPEIEPAAASSKLQLLGWNGIRLDYQSLQLALAWMESENLGHLKDR